MKQYKKDDSDMIWFDFNEVSEEQLDNCGLKRFDVFNVPDDYFPHYENYFVTGFDCRLGRCLMFIKKRF